MRILLSNDDGISADGLLHLARVLSSEHNITVVAPVNEKSASGHAMTIREILRPKSVDLVGVGCVAYSLNGTPVDCVKFAIDVLMDEPPDIVISGINDGANLGTDAIYSGTVSAALEGAILGYKSIAVSLYKTENMNYEYTAEFILDYLKTFATIDLPYGTMLNINVPAVDKKDIKGIAYTKQGIRRYTDKYLRREDPFGNEYYWLSGDPLVEKYNDSDTDVELIKSNNITIVPLSYNFTDNEVLNNLKKINKTT